MGDEDLNKIRIPLAELRMQIVEMMRQGETSVALGDYLHMLHAIYRKKQAENQELGED
jgi:hypothetical protein